jgi:tetratricopeptide (TPR) repeat protein
MSRKRPLHHGFLPAAAASLLVASASLAQEVRRAEPVAPDQGGVPTARAVPFEPFESPTPAAPPAPVATPASQAPAPADVNGDNVPALAPPDAAAQSADQVQLDFANGFYSRGLVDMAAPEYEKYLNLYPSAPLLDRESALFRVGECYRRTGNVNAAKNAYQTLLLNFAIGQFIGPAAYRLGDMCYAAKDYDGALNYYRKASVRLTDPTVALAARFYSGRCLEALDLPSEARITYEDIVNTKGDNPYREPSRLALAEILSANGRKEDALVQFTALAKEATQPTVKVEALVKAGLLEIDLSHPDKGAADLNKALDIPEIGQWQPIAEIGLLRVLYESGKYKQLLDQYQTAFDSLPDDIKPEVLILAANSKRQLGDFAGASDLYQQILKSYPTSTYADEARYQHLVALYNAGDPTLIPQIDEFLAGKPDASKRDQVTLLKAESLFKQQKYADAAPVYASLQDSDLSSAFKSDALFKLGWCYMQTHQPDKAIDALTGFLKNYPLDNLVPSALAQRAVAYQQSHDLTSALKDFDQLLSDYPKAKERELALQQKGLILGEQQDNAGMSATFKQLLEEFPHSPAAAQANYWIGSAAFSAKDYKACIPPLEAARRLDKAQFFERATVRIILAYYTLEDRDSLAAQIDLYNAGHPKDKIQSDVLRWLGHSYLEDKNYVPSQKYLGQLTARDDGTPDDWLDLGRAQLGAKQYPDAITSIQKYLAAQSDPISQAKGLLDLGQAQLESGKLDDAQASADKACSLQPEGLANGQGRMLAGDIQVARSDFDAAAKIYQSIAVIIDDPQLTPLAMKKAYDCLNRQGNTVEAAKVLNDLQTKYPEYPIKSGRLSQY